PISFVVITGLSGAGKSYAIKCFEAMGFFCVDNLPTTLMPTFADLVARAGDKRDRVALGVDVREGEYLSHLLEALTALRQRGHVVEVVFFEASEEALVRRYRETRRRHPLAPDGNVLDGIRAERKALSTVREVADRIVDPSALTVHQLKASSIEDFLRLGLPAYQREGKAYLTIAVGCTGGRHRSVALVEELRPFVDGLGLSPTLVHRDLDRE